MMCGTVRAIKNTPFIDVSLALPATGSGAGFAAPASYSQAGCRLEDCIDAFMRPELVDDVECLRCTVVQRMEELEKNAEFLRQTVEHVPSEEAAELERELATTETERRRLATLPLTQDASDVAALASVPAVRSKASKQYVFSRLPSVLCFHLGRRCFDSRTGHMSKLRQHVAFPLTLSMAQFSAYGGACGGVVSLDPPAASSAGGSAVEPFRYTLSSVVVHHGSSDAGHYTTFRKLRERGASWVHVSDEQVQAASVEQAFQRGASWVHVSDEQVQA
eukprot:CAMPEP_0205908924 /NCGR_PEP_ID=MMETSP1325-20131115/3535_1 /ASSEMBLY_ACC=CAM_ASM_000708 /TAXON_ID=236786 /ORGANISM="Florenciella sp., Strain RCC1007" /LENGTH=275 /DNA_ID=CAMNT_0053275175 /DNA_START=1 /DNA_END=826 /DNA_ORIENTATION=-